MPLLPFGGTSGGAGGPELTVAGPTTITAGTNSEYVIITAPEFAANSLAVGDMGIFTAWLRVSSQALATAFNVRLRLGGSQISVLVTTSPASAQVNRPMRVRYEFIVRSLGVNGVISIGGSLSTTFSATQIAADVPTNGAIINTTNANTLSLRCNFDVANASNSGVKAA